MLPTSPTAIVPLPAAGSFFLFRNLPLPGKLHNATPCSNNISNSTVTFFYQGPGTGLTHNRGYRKHFVGNPKSTRSQLAKRSIAARAIITALSVIATDKRAYKCYCPRQTSRWKELDYVCNSEQKQKLGPRSRVALPPFDFKGGFQKTRTQHTIIP